MQAVQTNRDSLSPKTLTIQDGRVVKIEEYGLWNGINWPTLTIERREADFWCQQSTPEGGGQKNGALAEILAWALHPTLHAQYIELFGLDEPTGADLRAAGFGRLH